MDSWRGGIRVDAGLPHSEIHGSKTACVSPWLIAACRVLPRLPPPRHPPCARTAWAPNPWRPARAARGNRAASVLASGARTRWARPAVLLLVGSLYSLSARARFCQERGRAAGCQRDRRGDGRADFARPPAFKGVGSGGMVGAHGLGPWTSSLSETRSNQLSYAPAFPPARGASPGNGTAQCNVPYLARLRGRRGSPPRRAGACSLERR